MVLISTTTLVVCSPRNGTPISFACGFSLLEAFPQTSSTAPRTRLFQPGDCLSPTSREPVILTACSWITRLFLIQTSVQRLLKLNGQEPLAQQQLDSPLAVITFPLSPLHPQTTSRTSTGESTPSLFTSMLRMLPSTYQCLHLAFRPLL